MARLSRPATPRPWEIVIDERTAEWTLHPIYERALAREKASRHKGRCFGWGFVGTTFGLCPGVVVIGLLHGIPVAAIVMILVGFLTVMVVFATESFRRKETASALEKSNRDELHGEYEAVGGWLVDLTILQGATPTGHDRGVVWSEEGRLFFVGARTSFGLFPSQISPGGQNTLASANGEAPLTLPLRIATAAGPVAIELDSPSKKDDPYASASLGWRVRSWLAEGVEGVGDWPPLSLGPDVPTPRLLLAKAIGTTAFWLAAPFLCFALVLSLIFTWLLCAGFPLVIAFFGFLGWTWRKIGWPGSHWLALLDRRRLDRSLRQNSPR